MKLRSLEVENFRRFVAPVFLGPFAAGLNTFVADNEIGKTTLAAAIRGVLFERYKARNERTRSFQHLCNQTAPRVRLAFALADGVYEIEKQFLKNAFARLTLPDGRRLDGDDAEEELERRLGFVRAGKVGADAETMGPWGMLWIEQEQATLAPAATDSARSSIHACLENEVGTLLGGGRTTRLIRIIDAALEERMTSQRKPRGRLKDLAADIETIEATLVQKRRDRELLQEQYATLETAEADLVRINDLQRASTDTDDLAQAKLDYEALTQKRSIAAQRRQFLETRKSDLDRLRADDALYERVGHTLESLGREIDVAKGEEEELTGRIAALKMEHAAAVAEIAEINAEIEALEHRLGEAMRLASANQAKGELERLGRILTDAQAAHELARTARTRLRAIDLLAIESALSCAKAMSEIDAKLTAVAPRLEAQLSAQGAEQVRVSGKPVPGEKFVLDVLGRTEIVIDGVGVISVIPGNDGQQAHRERLTRLSQERTGYLAKAGLLSIEDAAEAKEEAAELEREAAAQERAVITLIPMAQKKGIAQALAEMVDRVATLKTLAAAVGDENESFDILKIKRDDARLRLEKPTAARLATEMTLAGVRTRLGAAQARANSASANLVSWQAEKARLETLLPAADRAETLAALAAEVEALEAEVQAIEGEASDVAVSMVKARINRIETARQARENERGRLNVIVARTRATIEAASGDGLDEQIELGERDLERSRMELGALQRDTEVLDLLARELHAAEALAKERFLAPILKRVSPYLGQLLEGASLRMDENLALLGISRPGRGEEEFDVLSAGTREQIAVLVRLAFADILAAKGKPAMLVLDDVLSFADDRRRDVMFDILTVAAQRMQVVIFSCHKEAFEGLGAQRLEFKTDQPQPAAV
jgi:chromosome segregation ATPase